MEQQETATQNVEIKKRTRTNVRLARARTSLAEERTDWALKRSGQAAERTYSAWVRTGLAAEASGLGIAKLLGSLGVPTLTLAIGALFIIVGAGAYVFAFWSYYRRARELKPAGVDMPSAGWMGGIVALLLASSVIAFVLLFVNGPLDVLPLP